MNKKIVLSSNTSWSVYNFRLNLARELKKQGYKVVIVAPYDKYTEKLKKEFEYYDIWMNNKGTNPIEDIKTMIDFYRLYKKIKPDVALHYTIKPNIYGTIVCSLLGINTINNIAGLGTVFIRQSFITKVVKWLYKYSQRKATKVFFQNSDDYELFIKESLVEKNKCDLLPGSGVDTNRFTPLEYKKKDNKFKFLLIARMLWDKGIGEYVEAAKIIKSKYKNVEFQLLGPLDVVNPNVVSREQMQKWVDKGIVKYMGATDNVREYIKKADCVVLPSFYREGVPRVLLESASMAKPIITTDSVGCKEVVDDGVNGFLCKPKDPQDLAEKMEKMLKLNEEERKKMGMAGRMKVLKQFDEKIVINKYLEVIKTIFEN